MNFTSKICTTKEQSERLLTLELKPETADMAYIAFGGGGMMIHPYDWICNTKVDIDNFYPAWSLHRLIEIAEVSVEVSGLFIRISSTYYYEEKDNVYDNLIDAISELIKNEVFNKEYLKQ